MFTFAKLTGQLWKYRVWQTASVAAVLVSVAFFSLWRGNPAELPEGLTIVLSFPICIFWFPWWAAAIRCPTCGQRPVWYQMCTATQETLPRGSWRQGCAPACRFDPAARLDQWKDADGSTGSPV